MRRIKPTFFPRIYRGWKAGVAALVGVSSVLGLLNAILKVEQYCWYNWYYQILFVLVICVFVAYYAGSFKLIPSLVIDELSKENLYYASFCNTANLKEADEMTKPYFGSDYIPCDKIEQWRLRNPKGFVQILNAEGLLCACFVILGLKESFIEHFVSGQLTEHDIRSEDILDIDSAKKMNKIYFSGVVVRDPGSYMGHKRANIMLWAILQYVNKVYGLRKMRTFYAVAITPESEKLLKTLDFDLSCSKNNRKDHSNLYKIELDKIKWHKLLSRIGDYSRMVKIEFN